MNGCREIDCGQGLDLAAVEAALQVESLNGLRDQLVIFLLKELADHSGRVTISALALDAVGRYRVECDLSNGIFTFLVKAAD